MPKRKEALAPEGTEANATPEDMENKSNSDLIQNPEGTDYENMENGGGIIAEVNMPTEVSIPPEVNAPTEDSTQETSVESDWCSCHWFSIIYSFDRFG